MRMGHSSRLRWAFRHDGHRSQPDVGSQWATSRPLCPLVCQYLVSSIRRPKSCARIPGVQANCIHRATIDGTLIVSSAGSNHRCPGTKPLEDRTETYYLGQHSTKMKKKKPKRLLDCIYRSLRLLEDTYS
ncbi:hypothetical protein LSH36_316g07028 [Paralvinella palmiformis]|uniref:Uncharacterized protein n=1 Tax=Paralvinella palmiformis TaxID=53620 RepID=A0AAD9JHQ3_9ANNE|nr:hypothetical protein LSH36_316g07028 [Paralvinella palmiformis]